jgi:ribosomal protein S27AE
VLDEAGVEGQVHLGFTEKWGGSWQRQLQCPRCSRPARVLAVHDGVAACGRCTPRQTAHHKHKNSRAWREEGSLADEIVRTVLRGASSAGSSSVKRLANRLKARSAARCAVAHEGATRLIRAVDLSGLIHS